MMGIRTIELYFMECDHCETDTESEARESDWSFEECATAGALQDGWEKRGHLWLCPSCLEEFDNYDENNK